MKLRVVIADDQALMRTGFKTVIEATGTIEVVGRPATARRRCASPKRWSPTSC